jgi:hypothetical protein
MKDFVNEMKRRLKGSAVNCRIEIGSVTTAAGAVAEVIVEAVAGGLDC